MASNRPDTLDPALMRPGRLDRKVEFGLPDLEGRAHIFRIHAKSMSVERDIRFDLLARLCPNSTGELLAHLKLSTLELPTIYNLRHDASLKIYSFSVLSFHVFITNESFRRTVFVLCLNHNLLLDLGEDGLIALANQTGKDFLN